MDHNEPDRHEELDLTRVLHHLADRRGTLKGKERLANDEVTLLFLKAGVKALSEKPIHTGALTGPQIAKEAQKIDSQQGTSHEPNDGKFRDRWQLIEHYRADLFSYCLALQHWSLRLDDRQRIESQLIESAEFYEAVQAATYHDLKYALESELSRAAFLISLSAGNDSETMKAIRETNLDLRTVWELIFTGIFSQRQLRPRPGTGIGELAQLLVLLADGIAFRILTDESCDLIDCDRRESIFGKGAAALIAGFVDPGDGKSLRETLDGMGASARPEGTDATAEG